MNIPFPNSLPRRLIVRFRSRSLRRLLEWRTYAEVHLGSLCLWEIPTTFLTNSLELRGPIEVGGLLDKMEIYLTNSSDNVCTYVGKILIQNNGTVSGHGDFVLFKVVHYLLDIIRMTT